MIRVGCFVNEIVIPKVARERERERERERVGVS